MRELDSPLTSTPPCPPSPRLAPLAAAPPHTLRPPQRPPAWRHLAPARAELPKADATAPPPPSPHALHGPPLHPLQVTFLPPVELLRVDGLGGYAAMVNRRLCDVALEDVCLGDRLRRDGPLVAHTVARSRSSSWQCSNSAPPPSVCTRSVSRSYGCGSAEASSRVCAYPTGLFASGGGTRPEQDKEAQRGKDRQLERERRDVQERARAAKEQRRAQDAAHKAAAAASAEAARLARARAKAPSPLVHGAPLQVTEFPELESGGEFVGPSSKRASSSKRLLSATWFEARKLALAPVAAVLRQRDALAPLSCRPLLELALDLGMCAVPTLSPHQRSKFATS